MSDELSSPSSSASSNTMMMLDNILQWIFFGTKVTTGLLVIILTILYMNQDKMLYIPNPPGIPRTPSENPQGFNQPSEWGTNGKLARMNSGQNIACINYEEQFLTTIDHATIHTWLLLQDDSNNVPTIIFFHGNAGNMGFRLNMAALMFAITKCNILMMDYRGYGNSVGTPNETGLNIDADAVLLYAVKHPKLLNSKVIVFGQSLGGAVAISLAHRYPDLVSGVILENTFKSISSMVDVIMPFLKPLKAYVLNIKWNSDEKIDQLTIPILFISGDSDQLIPPSHMKSLFEAAVRSRRKEFYSVYGGTHNDCMEVAGVEYYRRMGKFILETITVNNNNNNNNDNNNSSSGSSSTGATTTTTSTECTATTTAATTAATTIATATTTTSNTESLEGSSNKKNLSSGSNSQSVDLSDEEGYYIVKKK